MKVVIDANIIKAYYIEDVLELDVVSGPDGLTASPKLLIDHLGKKYVCYLDDKGIIEYEWQQPVDPEWFQAWYGNLLINGAVQRIPAKRAQEIEKRIADEGFPTGRDKRYVLVAYNIIRSKLADESYLISEDLDFYDPKKKKGDSATRRKLLESGGGPVRRTLKKFKIHVTAVCHECLI